MPRIRRLWVPQAGAHTISRFVDRRFCLVDDEDRRSLLDAIGRANGRWDWLWLSYAMMSSHVHYGHIAGNTDPDRFFRSVHTRFAARYHRRRKDTLGPVFADRPKLWPIRPENLLRLVAYHHRNPVEARLVTRASDSTWTSHRAYLRVDPAPPWLDVERALDALGFRDTEAGRRSFDECVMEMDLDERSFEPLDDAKDVAFGVGAHCIDWSRLIDLARRITGLPANEALESKGRTAVKTKRLIATVATRDLGQPYHAVATKLGMSTGSVFNLLSRREIGTDLDSALCELRRRLATK